MPMKTSNFHMKTFFEDIDDKNSKEEPKSCKHFLVDSECGGNGRHSVFNFTWSSFITSFLNDKLDHVYTQLKCAAKFKLAFGIV